MLIRSETPQDHDSVRRVVTDAFGGDQVPLLLDAMRDDPMWRGLAWLAEDEHGVTGHVALTRAWLDTRRALVEVLVLSPLSVAPARQRSGTGGSLVRHALAAAERVGSPMVFLEGAPGYYSRFGFVGGETLGHTSPSPRIPGPAFQVHPLPSAEAWMTGRLVYPELFWRHDAVGLRDPELAQIEEALSGL